MPISAVSKAALASLLCLALSGPVADSAEQLNWESVPLSIGKYAEGTSKGGDGFQMVESIVYAPSDAQRVYLSTNTSQVWRSDSSGYSWYPARNGIASHGVASLSVSHDNPDIVVAAGTYGANRQRVSRYPDRHEGIYLTTDGGQSWNFVHSARFSTTTNKGRLVAISGSSPDYHLYAGTQDQGLIHSIDNGKSWQPLAADLADISDIAIVGTDILVAAKQGLYRYRDNNLIKLGKNLTARPLSVASSAHDPDTVWVSLADKTLQHSNDAGTTFTAGSQFTRGVQVLVQSTANPKNFYAKRDRSHLRNPMYSQDGGSTWHLGSYINSLDAEFDRANQQFWFSSPFAAHPTEAATALGASNGRGRILKTSNGGRSWLFSGRGFTGSRVIAIDWLPDGRGLFCYTDHGIWRSHAGHDGPYIHLRVPRIHKLTSCAAMAYSDGILVAAIGSWNKQQLLISKDQGDNWRIIPHSEQRHRFLAFNPLNSQQIFARNIRSLDGGSSWSPLTKDTFAIDNQGRLYALEQTAGQIKVFTSSDAGDHWQETASIHLGVKQVKVNQLLNTRDQDPTLFISTSIGLIKVNGKKWQLLGHKQGLSRDQFGKTFVDQLAIDGKNRIYAGRRSPGVGQSNGVFMSTDNGESWANITANLGPYLTVWSINIGPDDAPYIGTSLGTYKRDQ